jgi:hypothetical protein
MRPALEVADIVRAHGEEFRQAHAASLSTQQKRVLRSIELCRTAALGGHLERCDQCGHERNAYNSCADRHFMSNAISYASVGPGFPVAQVCAEVCLDPVFGSARSVCIAPQMPFSSASHITKHTLRAFLSSTPSYRDTFSASSPMP